jgi:hypothetical protein
MPKITHSELPGTEVEVSADSLPHYRAAGWVPVGEEQPSEEPAAAEPEADDAPSSALADDSKDTTPKGRRATKKDGE